MRRHQNEKNKHIINGGAPKVVQGPDNVDIPVGVNIVEYTPDVSKTFKPPSQV